MLVRTALVAVTVPLIALLVGSAWAETKEFYLVTDEVKWQGKAGETVVDRGRGPVPEIERYVFIPAFLVVRKGDEVVLRIHVVKGKEHVIRISAFGVQGVRIKRGEQQVIRFVADKAGLFEILCMTHRTPEHEGPMVAYLHVVER